MTISLYSHNDLYIDYIGGAGFHYRENDAMISWVYNQLPIWIGTALFLQNRKIHNYAFIGLLVFPFSPWGNSRYRLGNDCRYVISFLQKEKYKSVLFEIFSIQNILAVISILPCFLSFFSVQEQIDSEGKGIRLVDLGNFTAKTWAGIIIFWLCEFGIYYIKHGKNLSGILSM